LGCSPFGFPPFEIADDRSAYQRQLIEVEGESGVAQYRRARFTPDKKTIEIPVRPRKGSAAF
jgi:hypothetical protein